MKRNNRLLAVIVVTLIFGFLLTVCSTSMEMKIRFAPGGEPKTLDPQLYSGIPEAIIEMALFEGITRLDKNNVPQLAVANSVEVSPDGLNYRIILKSTKFSDGDPLTAYDFKASWMHALNSEAKAAYAYPLFYIKNAEAYYSRSAKAEDVGIKVMDDRTLEVTLGTPCPFFKSLLALPTYFPVDQQNAQAHKNWYADGTVFVGNGPFMIKRWSHNDKMILVKNPNYYDAANVKLKEIDFYLVQDGKKATTAFEAGKLDGLNNLVQEDIFRLKRDGNLKAAPMLGTDFYRINTTKKPLNDLRVRQALSIVLNRQDLLGNVIGGEIPAYAFVPGTIPDAVPDKDFRKMGGNLINEDIAKAKQLLAEAGYPEGRDFPVLTILYNTNGKQQLPAQAIQDCWKRNLGINVKLQGQGWDDYQQNQQGLGYDIARACWIGDYVDPMTFLAIFHSNSGNNETGWTNGIYDKDIETAQKSSDQRVRMEAMHEAEKILMQEMPIIPVYYYVQNYILKDNIKGVIVSPLDFFDFKYAAVQ